jgi:predicted TIM-barrel fold metal-dependent hydrolase
MLIVDSQVHIWAASTQQRPWPAPDAGRAAEAHRPVPLGHPELRKEMDAAGVQAVIIVPPSWEGDYNDLALEAARLHPRRFAVMGRLDTTRKDAPGLVKTWRSQPGMLGLRFMLTPGSPLLAEGAASWLWPVAEKAGVPITISARGNAAIIGEVARRHPGLRLSIDHIGAVSSKRGAEAFLAFADILALGRLPNVAVKVSALPCISGEPYPFRNTHGHLRQVYEAFGAERMFWGTDLSRFPCSYSLGVSMFTEELPWLKGAELEQVMGKAVLKWFGWDLQA